MSHVIGFSFDTDLMSGDMTAQTSEIEQSGDFLNSAIKASLFTNRRDPSQQLGGCWSDALYSDSFGSLLWTKARAKITNTLLIELEQICRDALRWLVVDGHVESIDVAVERSTAHGTTITVTSHLNSGETANQIEPNLYGQESY